MPPFSIPMVLTAPQNKKAAPPQAWLRGFSDLGTRVVDRTYAINGKLPGWPGDDRTFEAKVEATPEKDGYFARGFWTLEHSGTHLDAPAHFAPGKEYLDPIQEARHLNPRCPIRLIPKCPRHRGTRCP
jgi:kynurenine formamidase